MDRRKIRILQIEDNPGDARLIREMLRESTTIEYNFREVSTIETAKQFLGSGDIDIILLDLGLGETTGLDTLKKLLADCEHDLPAVIVMTGLDDEEYGMQAVQQGAQDYLVKNKIGHELLSRSIRYAFERDESKRKLQQAYDQLENKVRERTVELSLAVQSLEKEVAERKKAEEDREMVLRQMTQLQKMESLGTLAGGIAHDFNNILGGIIGYADLSFDDTPTGSRLEHNLQQIILGGERAKRLIQQILNFSRSNPVEKTPQYLSPIIREAIGLLRAGMPSSIEIKSTLAEDTAPVLADATQIHEILMNLCTNAKQAMNNEKGIIEVTHEEVAFDHDIIGRAGTLPCGRYSVISVADNGCGIDEKTMARVFDPFFTTKAPGEGTGMGLSVLYGIVQSHDGTVTVDSLPGKGTTFRVYLPKSEQFLWEESYSDLPLEGGCERIMYIDDEEVMIAVAKGMLESLGYMVTIFRESMKALDAFKEDPDAFDLIISDQTMPLLTGLDLAKEIRRLRPDIPIILTTGYSRVVDDVLVDTLGINLCLHKPFLKKDIAGKIRQVLQQDKLTIDTGFAGTL